jgi:hypothetical protein
MSRCRSTNVLRACASFHYAKFDRLCQFFDGNVRQVFLHVLFGFNVHHYRLNARKGIREIKRDDAITLETFQFPTVDRSDATRSTGVQLLLP